MVLLFLRLSTRQIRRPHNEFHLLQPILWSLHTVRSLIFPLVAKASACRRGQEAQYLHRKASPFLPELPRISGGSHSGQGVHPAAVVERERGQGAGFFHQLVSHRHLSISTESRPSLLGGHLLLLQRPDPEA